MNPYKELQKLLAPKMQFKEFGKVSYVDQYKVHVNVNGRPKIYDRQGARYKKGDEVVIQGDILIGIKRKVPNVNVYQV